MLGTFNIIVYRVSQEERPVFWEVIVSVIINKSVHVHVSYSERLELFHVIARIEEVRRATRHVLTRIAKCTDVEGGVCENVLY
jgi:hypothetical protein